jgi:hypothetical protein
VSAENWGEVLWEICWHRLGSKFLQVSCRLPGATSSAAWNDELHVILNACGPIVGEREFKGGEII